ncbi:MAG TPA: choice-of-anchor L domain-containing protein [Candidatus Binatia bacterium]|nr:choice-of-anchor L domain-containing protein [Candidatus Binatia bacterium]
MFRRRYADGDAVRVILAGVLIAAAAAAPSRALAQSTTTMPETPTTTFTPPTTTLTVETTTTTFHITSTTDTTSTTMFEPAGCEVPDGANLVVTDLTDGLTANDLAASLVGDGVTVSNVVLTGAPIAAGRFVDAASVTGIPTGVILSSGCAKSAAGPNDQDGYSVLLGTPGDSDLSNLIGGAPTNDATILEFDFVPETDTIQVRYVFSSEEYNEFVNSEFNDVFGFFVNGVNQALLPDNVTVVSINNVNGGKPLGTNASNPSFYRNNDLDDGGSLDIEPDGMTVELVLTAAVTPDQTNHFKIAVADTGDRSLDSWIFLQTGSFTSVENCGNERDDDGDELIDAADPNCWICGNGRQDPGEACDDGDIDAGDGCDPLCNTETPQLCGNETIDDGETCDDGNTGSGDGCDGQCQIELPPAACGNGCVEQGESCDDGDTASGDGCSATCEQEQCFSCTSFPTSTSTTLVPALAVEGPGCGGPSVCAPDVGASCDDGDLCTVGDSCGNGGTCGGDAVIIPAACRWVMVGGDPSRRVRARTRGQTEVTGDICGEETVIGETSTTDGDVVGMYAIGNGVRIGPAASISGDVVTAGGAVKGKPAGSILPETTVDFVAGNTSLPKGGDVYDTTGTHAQVAACNQAQDEIDSSAALLDALPSSATLGNVHIEGGSSLTLAPGITPGVVAGALNVIDIDRFTSGNEVDLILDGGGNPDTVYVLRVAKKLDLHFRGGLLITGDQQASKVIVYGKNKCKFGEEVTGSGTVICPEGKLLMEERASWTGALLGGKQIVQLRDSGVLTHVPLQVGP